MNSRGGGFGNNFSLRGHWVVLFYIWVRGDDETTLWTYLGDVDGRDDLSVPTRK